MYIYLYIKPETPNRNLKPQIADCYRCRGLCLSEFKVLDLYRNRSFESCEVWCASGTAVAYRGVYDLCTCGVFQEFLYVPL